MKKEKQYIKWVKITDSDWRGDWKGYSIKTNKLLCYIDNDSYNVWVVNPIGTNKCNAYLTDYSTLSAAKLGMNRWLKRKINESKKWIEIGEEVNE